MRSHSVALDVLGVASVVLVVAVLLLDASTFGTIVAITCVVASLVAAWKVTAPTRRRR